MLRLIAIVLDELTAWAHTLGWECRWWA